MFGNTNFMKGKKGTNKMIQLMIMSEMFKGGQGNGFAGSLPMLMMMNGGMGDMFEGMFDFGLDNDDDTEDKEG